MSASQSIKSHYSDKQHLYAPFLESGQTSCFPPRVKFSPYIAYIMELRQEAHAPPTINQDPEVSLLQGSNSQDSYRSLQIFGLGHIPPCWHLANCNLYFLLVYC
nr:uncharacterized protein LOC128684641 [Cherax quadricarinatus]